MRSLPAITAILVLGAGLSGWSEPAGATFVAGYTSHDTTGNRVVFHCGVPAVAIDLMTDHVFRLSLYSDGIVGNDSSFVVLPHDLLPVPYTLEVLDTAVVIRTAALTIECRKNPFRVRIADLAGATFLTEPTSGGLGWNGTERSFRFSVGSDHLYGMGERALPFDRRGQRFDTYNQAIYGYGSFAPNMNINIPFLTSDRGWGLYFDNPWPGSFDLASTSPGIVTGKAENGPMHLYFVHGPDLAAILERYTWLTGRSPMPPRWALGYLQSKFGYHDRAEVEALVDEFHDRDIPLDGVILDLYWFGQPSDMGRLAWDAASWPDPGGMIAALRAQKIRTVLIEEPYLITSTANYTSAAAQGFLGKTSGGQPYAFSMWAGTAGLVDFTNPAAADWWWGLHQPLLADGVAGWWLDLGEPETHPNDMVHTGGAARGVHNRYNDAWLGSLSQHLRAQTGQRPFLLTRAGFAGLQRNGAITWSGDVQKSFSALAVQIPMLLGMGLSGAAWHNSDIGGFTGSPTSPELYARWMQFGAFCPVTRAHGSGQDTEPWTFGATTEAICRKFLRLRQRLVPYLYTLARENHLRGVPLARPLVMEFPADANAPGISNEYCLGRALLVAPVTTAGATSRSVYLPAGRWTNYWTNQIVKGAQSVTVAAPLDQMPLFVREGSIVPLQNPMPAADAFALDTLALDVFPADTASFELYEDDGASLAYESGAFATTALALAVDGIDARVHIGAAQGAYSGKPPSRTWVVQMRHVLAPPVSVEVGALPLAQRADSSGLAVNPSGWWYDAAGSRAQIKLRLDASERADIVLRGVRVAEAPGPRPVHSGGWKVRFAPNPAAGATWLVLTRPPGSADLVELKLFDLQGREVADLSHAVRFDGDVGSAALDHRDWPSGVYLVRLRTPDERASFKVTLLR